jgi:hypothetical protein
MQRVARVDVLEPELLTPLDAKGRGETTGPLDQVMLAVRLHGDPAALPVLGLPAAVEMGPTSTNAFQRRAMSSTNNEEVQVR